MPASLDGIAEKIKRAIEGIHNLNREIAPFIERNTQAIIFENDPNTREHFAMVQYREQPPLSWSVLFGEVAYHLRSALDHLACILSASGNCSKTEFPIYDEAGFEKDKTAYRRKVELFVKPAQALVESLQPYRRGPQSQSDPLFRLHWLNNRDKHKMLNLLVAAMEMRKVE